MNNTDVRRRITLAFSVMSSLDCIWKERRLPLSSKYAFILLSSTPSYSMPPRHGLSLQQMPSPWRHSIWNANAESWESSGGNLFATRKYLRSLPAINDVIRHRRTAVFGHIARLQDSTPAHKALQSHVNLSLGRLPHPSWSRRPGRPRGRQMDRPNPKRHQPDTCRPLETGPWTRSSWTSDATAHAGYAMMMMMMNNTSSLKTYYAKYLLVWISHTNRIASK